MKKRLYNNILIGDITVDRVIYSDRRTICLSIDANALLTVRAPHKSRQERIANFILSRKSWIEKHTKILSARSQCLAVPKFQSGSSFPFLGRLYPLSVVKEALCFFSYEHGFCISEKFIQNAESMFACWYRRQAQTILSSKLAESAEKHGFEYSRFKLSSASARWGSCSSSGCLSLSWRLIMLPPEIIDYVIFHELAHTKEMNHSSAFWDFLGSIMPDYELRRKWITDNGHKYSFL